MYIGRAVHAGNILPVKVFPTRMVAFLGHDGEEFVRREFDILCNETPVTWVPYSGGHLPVDAFIVGTTVSGENLYLGRAKHEESLTIGR